MNTSSRFTLAQFICGIAPIRIKMGDTSSIIHLLSPGHDLIDFSHDSTYHVYK